MTFTVSREQWGARSPRGTTSWIKRSGICWHWYGIDHMSDDHDTCLKIWRQAQHFHMSPRGLGVPNGAADIAYNKGFCNHGGKFEGRGFDVASGANGDRVANREWLAICFIGAVNTQLSNDAIQAMIELRQEASDHGFANVNRPHSYFYKNTSCPGDQIRGVINSFPTSVGAASQSKQTILGATTNLSEDRFQVEAMVMELPVVSRGTNGQFARICQGLLIANGRSVIVDGDFGPKSEAALIDFQRATGLTADGVCGKITWRRLLCI